MLPNRIDTIAELQAEQDRLVGNMRLAREEFGRSMGKTTVGGRDFLLKYILLPAGALGLGIFVAKKLSDSPSTREENSEQVEYGASTFKEPSNGWFPKLMLVALPVAQQFFLNAKATETAEGSTTNDEPQTRLQANGAAGWVSTLVPMVIPMLQQYFLERSEQANERALAVDLESGGSTEGAIATRKNSPSSIFDSLYKMLPVVLPLIQQYFGAGTVVKHEDKTSGGALAKNGQYAEVAT